MAALAEWDRILANWALWLLGGRGGSGYASPIYSLAPRGRRSDDYTPLLLAEATDIDTMIRKLPKKLQNAVLAWYVWSQQRIAMRQLWNRVVAASFAVSVTGLAAADPAADFEGFVHRVANETTQAAPVYLNKYKNLWAKRRFSIADLKYDVKKTDSLLNPIVGIVEFKLHADQSGFYATEVEAMGATDLGTFPPSITRYG